MTQTILNFLMPQKVKAFLLKVKAFLKGKKTYLAATILLLQALLSYLDQALALNGMADFILWIKDISANDATAMLAQALAVFGIRAAVGIKKGA